MTDIVERLEEHWRFDYKDSLCEEAAAEIKRLRAEAELWKSRYEAERADHEATQKAWDEDKDVYTDRRW